jgi:hypothetical protein
MNITPGTMRALLIVCMAGMALLAAFYLRRRMMSTRAYLAWGLLALLLPLLGPFLVILNHPGHLRPSLRRPRLRHFKSTSMIAVRIRRLRNRRMLR